MTEEISSVFLSLPRHLIGTAAGGRGPAPCLSGPEKKEELSAIYEGAKQGSVVVEEEDGGGRGR